MNKKAIFFDRDDTLIIDQGYMYKTSDLNYFPDTIETLKSLTEQGYLLFIVTNQSGVGRGYFSIDQMHKFNENLIQDLKSKKVIIQDIAFCPHAPDDGCVCRKPRPKMILDLCQKYNIDQSQSFMFGDKQSDLEAGENAKLKSFILHGNDIKDVLSHVLASKS